MRNDMKTKHDIPMRSVRLLPKRSAARPPKRRNPPNVSAYAVMTHCKALSLPKCSADFIEGSATLVMEISKTTMNCAIATTKKISHLLFDAYGAIADIMTVAA